MALFTPEYDGDELVKFPTLANYNLYYTSLRTKSISCEQYIRFVDFEGELDWINKRGWRDIMNVQGLLCEPIVREMVANFDAAQSNPSTIDDNAQIVTTVRGHRLVISPQVITQMYGIGAVAQNEGDEPYTYSEHEITFHTDPDLYVGLFGVMLRVGSEWPESGRVQSGEIRSEYLTIMHSTFKNVLPLKRGSDVDSKRALLIYAIYNRWKVDLATYIFDVLYARMMTPTSQHSIPFGLTLTRLAFGVLPSAIRDTLPTEYISSEIGRGTINRSLAHIPVARGGRGAAGSSRRRGSARGGRAAITTDPDTPSTSRAGVRRVRPRRADAEDEDMEDTHSQFDDLCHQMTQFQETHSTFRGEMMTRLDQMGQRFDHMEQTQTTFQGQCFQRFDHIDQMRRESDARATEYQRLLMEQFQSFHPYGPPPPPQ